jgi:hypothetical protein
MMQKTTLIYCAAAFLLLSVFGCKVGELEDVVVVADVENEFYLDLWEDLSLDGRSLEFRIETIRKENCKNTLIDYRLHKTNSNIAISLRDIRQPATCDPGPAPARIGIDVGSLKAGFYTFSIDLKNTVFNEGQLTALNDRYLIRLETENGVQLVRKELFRVPDETIWGYVHYQSPDDEYGALQFINQVKELGGSTPFKQGYYGYFTVGNNGQILAVQGQPEEGQVKPFLFSYRGGKQQLQDLINQFRTNYGAEVSFQLYNSLGESF